MAAAEVIDYLRLSSRLVTQREAAGHRCCRRMEMVWARQGRVLVPSRLLNIEIPHPGDLVEYFV